MCCFYEWKSSLRLDTNSLTLTLFRDGRFGRSSGYPLHTIRSRGTVNPIPAKFSFPFPNLIKHVTQRYNHDVITMIQCKGERVIMIEGNSASVVEMWKSRGWVLFLILVAFRPSSFHLLLPVHMCFRWLPLLASELCWLFPNANAAACMYISHLIAVVCCYFYVRITTFCTTPPARLTITNVHQ